MNSGYEGSLPEALGKRIAIFGFFVTTIGFFVSSSSLSLLSSSLSLLPSLPKRPLPGKKPSGNKARRGVGLVDAVVGWRDLASSLLGDHTKVVVLFF